MSLHLRSMRRSSLRKRFDQFNRDYFAGRKPRYDVRRRFLRGVDGYCDTAGRRILINDRDLAGSAVDAVLLHEMCHIGCRTHGDRFQSELRRLLGLVPKAVATHLRRDLRSLRYALNREISEEGLRVLVSDALEELAKGCPDLPWGLVRTELLTGTLFHAFTDPQKRRQRRVLAWAKRMWANRHLVAAREM